MNYSFDDSFFPRFSPLAFSLSSRFSFLSSPLLSCFNFLLDFIVVQHQIWLQSLTWLIPIIIVWSTTVLPQLTQHHDNHHSNTIVVCHPQPLYCRPNQTVKSHQLPDIHDRESGTGPFMNMLGMPMWGGVHGQPHGLAIELLACLPKDHLGPFLIWQEETSLCLRKHKGIFWWNPCEFWWNVLQTCLEKSYLQVRAISYFSENRSIF